MNEKQKAAEIVAAVMAGDVDGELNDVVRAIKARREWLALERAAKLQVGDAVVLTGLSPKYLNGLRGTVVAKGGRRGKVQVDVPQLVGTRFASVTWIAPSCLRPAVRPAHLHDAEEVA